MNPHHRSLKRAWQQKQRAKLAASLPLPLNLLHELLDHLGDGERRCDHTLTRTVAFLQQHNLEEEPIIVWLGEHGGYCDCEVLANVEDVYEEILNE